MTKTIDTLVEDIYDLFKNQPYFEDKSEIFLNSFGDNLMGGMYNRFFKKRDNTPKLRMSSIGKQDRQLWYDHHPDGSKEDFLSSTLIKFSYGDMIEEMVLLYAKLAGHTVEREQEEISVEGVKGHIDVMIDGVVVDIKSASTYSFQKFATGDLLKEGNDPFGYQGQLAGYVEALTPGKGGAFLAVDKTLGKLTLLQVPAETLQKYAVRDRINYLKEMVVQDVVPDKCYSPVPDGKSGNEKLAVGCSYCAHKFRCWPEVKTYYYSTGPRYLTTVKREPKVEQANSSPFKEMDSK